MQKPPSTAIIQVIKADPINIILSVACDTIYEATMGNLQFYIHYILPIDSALITHNRI